MDDRSIRSRRNGFLFRTNIIIWRFLAGSLCAKYKANFLYHTGQKKSGHTIFNTIIKYYQTA